jgi:hypothetical protein
MFPGRYALESNRSETRHCATAAGLVPTTATLVSAAVLAETGADAWKTLEPGSIVCEEAAHDCCCRQAHLLPRRRINPNTRLRCLS